MTSGIFGGVISESQFRRDMRKNVWGSAMAFVMPDKQYEKYIALKQQGKHSEATRLFKRYARSTI